MHHPSSNDSCPIVSKKLIDSNHLNQQVSYCSQNSLLIHHPFKWQLYYCAKKIHSDHSSEHLLYCSTIDKFKHVQTNPDLFYGNPNASSILIGRPAFFLQTPNDYHSKLITGLLFSNSLIIHHPLQMTPDLLFPTLINYASPLFKWHMVYCSQTH
jgi:hypothetical protein